MKKLMTFVLALVCILSLTSCRKNDTYKIRITVPDGSTEAFVYSDEEISPKGNKITISSVEGLGDTEVVLRPIEVKEENAYEPTYLTQGMPVEMDVEKGAWFKVGVSMQNETDSDKMVYVEVEGVEVGQQLPFPERASEESVWGITLDTENVSPSGLTIVCNQTGGCPTGELDTGSWYVLEKYTEKGWTELEKLPQRYDVAWTSEAWIIPMEDSVKWDVNWEWLYGKLRVGKYRIGKEIMDFRGAGDYDTKIHYAEFEIYLLSYILYWID